MREHLSCNESDPFALLADVADATARDAELARALFAGMPAGEPYDMAVRAKRMLAARGFRDDASAFCLPDMLGRRGGNCLGLTLLVGAALLDRGHDVSFVVLLDPLDDVHDEGVDYFARLVTEIDGDSPLPEAADRAARGRFIPVEHASIVLPGGMPFEATNLSDVEVPPGWSPAAESVRAVGFRELAAMVLAERAKLASDPRDMIRLALRALRRDRGNREAWVEVWRGATELGRRGLAALAETSYVAASGDDSLYYFTRYRMRGEIVDAERALARLPSYAEAYIETQLARSRGDDHEVRRILSIGAWLAAGSEILDLERWYRDRVELYASAFSADELDAVLATFSPDEGGGGNSRS